MLPSTQSPLEHWPRPGKNAVGAPSRSPTQPTAFTVHVLVNSFLVGTRQLYQLSGLPVNKVNSSTSLFCICLEGHVLNF